MDDSNRARLRPMIETIEGMRRVVYDQTRLIDKCLHHLAMNRDGKKPLPKGEPEVLEVILTMIHMVGISGHSLLRLTDKIDLGVKDAFPVARSIIEGAINICFIMARGAETAGQAARHAEVKAYRDLKREWEVAGMTVSSGHSGKLPKTEVDRLEAMLPEFTTKRGHEKNWTDKSLKQRLADISDAFPSTAMISLNTSAFAIYRHASEVVHASYFSARYFWGLTLPGRPPPASREELELTLVDHQFSILMSTIFAYAGLVECFTNYSGIAELNDDANSQLDRLREFPAIKEALEEG